MIWSIRTQIFQTGSICAILKAPKFQRNPQVYCNAMVARYKTKAWRLGPKQRRPNTKLLISTNGKKSGMSKTSRQKQVASCPAFCWTCLQSLSGWIRLCHSHKGTSAKDGQGNLQHFNENFHPPEGLEMQLSPQSGRHCSLWHSSVGPNSSRATKDHGGQPTIHTLPSRYWNGSNGHICWECDTGRLAGGTAQYSYCTATKTLCQLLGIRTWTDWEQLPIWLPDWNHLKTFKRWCHQFGTRFNLWCCDDLNFLGRHSVSCLAYARGQVENSFLFGFRTEASWNHSIDDAVINLEPCFSNYNAGIILHNFTPVRKILCNLGQSNWAPATSSQRKRSE